MAYNANKHPSFLHKTMPYQQLMAKMTPFNNGMSTTTTPYHRTSPSVLTTVGEPSELYEMEAGGMTTGKLQFVEPMDHGVAGQKKKLIPTAANQRSQMSTLLARPEDDFDPENMYSDYDLEYMTRQREAEEAARIRAAQSLIGGQSGKPDERWKTSQQWQNEGNPMGRSQSAGSKRVLPAQQQAFIQQVSPITGQQTANYGTWRNDTINKLAYAEAETAALNTPAKNGLLASSGIPLLDKLRVKLASRGANGLLGMARMFRTMDDDDSKSLDLKEFKKAMRDLALMLTELEVKQLFQLFDRDGSGTIGYDEFIAVLRGPMNPRRKALVQMAFDVIDRDGSGTLDISDIMDVYDVTKHPDFLARKKTKEKILSEFLDHLTTGTKGNGMVTREGFEDYYANISASVDSDDYFELMMRNAWHISGGEGQAANSANRRVLVANADGSQRVVEIKNDLGLKADDKAGMMSRLQKQGLKNAANLALFGSAGDDVKYDGINRNMVPTGQQPQPQSRTHVRPSSAGVAGTRNNNPSGKGSNTIPLQFPPPRLYPAPAGSIPQPLTHFAPVSTSDNDNEITHPLLDALRLKLVERGAMGLIGLQRVFRIMDDDGSQALNMSEFKKAMKEMKIVFKRDSDVEVLFRLFDRDRSGSISYNEFITMIRGKLNPRRKALVGLAFTILDKDGNGVVEPSDLIGMYNTSKHPEVLSHRKSPEQVLREFLDGFDVGGVVDGKVTLEEFENYYSNISASIDDDDYFELMIRNAWHISGGTGQAANSSNRRVLVTRSDGTQSVQIIKNDLGLHAGDKAGMMSRLQSQGVDVTGISTFDGIDNRTGGKETSSIVARLRNKAEVNRATRSPDRQRQSSYASQPIEIPQVPLSASALDIALAGPYAPNPAPSSSAAKPFAPAKVPAGLSYYLEQVKKQFKLRGPAGYCEMQSIFESMDTDGSKTLTLQELKHAFKMMNIPISENDLRRLFSLFDRDESGTIDFTEFVDGIRTPLSSRRLALVQLVFSELDAECSELLSFEDIAMRYNANGHPEVITKRLTAKQALAAFVDTFVGGTEVEGKVTLNEFINYYTNVGSAIDNDDYFDLLVRNVWGLETTGRGIINNKIPVKSALRTMLTDPSPVKPQRQLSAAAQQVQKRWSSVPGQNIYQTNEMPSLQQMQQQQQQLLQQRQQPTFQPPPQQTSLLRPSSAAPTIRPQSAGAVKRPIIRSNPQGGPIREQVDRIPPAGLAFMLQQMKSTLKSRGDAGYTSLLRVFQSMDTNDDQTLSMAEFKNALKSLQLVEKESEVRLLFEYFDTDNSESISWDEFLAVVRPPLSEKRLSLVRRAFATLDTNGDGALDIPTVAGSYNAMQHPEVLNGRLTARQALALFLDTFDAGGDVDGKVTKNEFIAYYTNVGATIDDDSYFESLLRGVWGMTVQKGILGQGFRSGPLNPTGQGSMLSDDISLLDTKTVTESTIREEIKALKTQAVLRYNQRDYANAGQIFTSMLQYLQQLYPANHPECLTAQKSIIACNNKILAQGRTM